MADEFETKDLNDNLDDFDLDTEFGGEDFQAEDEDAVPKSRVKEIVQKRLARERNKIKALYDQFKEVYGMSPEEIVEYGRREAAKYASRSATQNQAPGSTVPDAGANPAPAGMPEVPQDPVMQKILELEAKQREMEEARQREREAMEFVQKYPNVKFSDIPPEVLQRRAQGGVTLAEAYKLYIADKEAEEAAKRAAEETAKNYKAREKARAEGADFSGGAGGNDTGSLTEEERQFAKAYGMAPKQYAAYKAKVRQMLGEEE